MTSPISANNRRAFTLTELLVVIGIIGVLIAILLPASMKAMAAAQKARMTADLNAIAVALDLYHDDFHDYPRYVEGELATPTPTNYVRKYGSECLVRALIAPFPKNPKADLSLNASGYTAQKTTDYFDGADGPGFRIRRIQAVSTVISMSADSVQGEVKGPYLAPDKFTFTTGTEPELQDRNGNTILYYPARLSRPNIRATASKNYVDDTAFNGALYDNRYGSNKLQGASGQPTYGLRILLGDLNYDGDIDANETPATVGPYILISPGNDGAYGLSSYSNLTSVGEIPKLLRQVDDIIFFKN